uniref:CA domain-containing protein n=1 Tax=Heterorhabditis bacteriophora TaxID=37862 RepID=A0A1I7WFF1_HETBA
MLQIFNIDSLSGTFCLEKHLDYETTTSYQFTISATDQNGLTGTSLISVRIVDVNDNVPVFYPTDYNITVRDGPHSLAPLMIVSATDKDSFGKACSSSYVFL